LIRVEDLGAAVLGQRLLEHLDTEIRGRHVRSSPRQYSASRPVQFPGASSTFHSALIAPPIA
jgi:hypothetical protein